MVSIYKTEQHRETEESLLNQMKDGVKTLLQTIGIAIFKTENKEIPESKCKQMYNAASTVPIVRLQ
jgi:hypothetical protein